MLLLLLACTHDPVESGLTPQLDLLDLGVPAVAQELTLDTSDPEAVWLAAEHTLPGLGWVLPGLQIPGAILEILAGPRVSDAAACPYETAEGSAVVVRSECRSSGGYDWTGGYQVEGDWTTYDLEVTSDVEDRLFDRAALQGDIVDRSESGVRQLQLDLVVELEGYWSQRNDSIREAVWSGLAVTGWAEVSDGTWVLDVRTSAGELGTWAAWSEALTLDGCDREPVGTATLVGVDALQLTGDTACDGCLAGGGETFCP